MLADADAALGSAIQHGIDWFVIHWKFETEYPALVRLILDSDNIPGRPNRAAGRLLSGHSIP